MRRSNAILVPILLSARVSGWNKGFPKHRHVKTHYSLRTDLWLEVLERIRDELPGTNTMQVERMKMMLGSEIKLHSELGCTQRIYHYLVPLSWLPDGDLLQQWWKSSDKVLQSNKSMKKVQKPPESLRRFKAALRSAESVKVDDVDYRVPVVMDEHSLLSWTNMI
jgi:hypothetical protein